MKTSMWTIGRRLLSDAFIIARDFTDGGFTGECPGCPAVRRFLEGGCELRATCPHCGAVFINVRGLEGARARSGWGPRRFNTDLVPVCDWQPTYWRSRWVRIAPCPGRDPPAALPGRPWPHERIVVDDPDDPEQRDHVCCTCGYQGPHAATEEQAVEAFNREQGLLGVEPVTAWVYHPNRCVAPGHTELPF